MDYFDITHTSKLYTLWYQWFGVDWGYAVRSALKTRSVPKSDVIKALFSTTVWKRKGLFLVPFLFLLLCYILTWMVPGSWNFFRERECEVVAGALFPSTLFWTIVKIFKQNEPRLGVRVSCSFCFAFSCSFLSKENRRKQNKRLMDAVLPILVSDALGMSSSAKPTHVTDS